MSVLFKISLRNLFRQKRRNILLGSGIAFGMCILIVANAFSHGLTDILLNKIIKWMTGHILVTTIEKDEKEWGIIRDKDRFIQILQERIEGEKEIYEGVASESGSGGSGEGHDHDSGTRAIGKGSAEFLVVVGIASLDEGFSEVIIGKLEDISNPQYENPILLYDDMAEKLNVGLHETIRIRFSTVYGQVQAARFTVVAILKSTNPFMSFASFTSLETLKPLVALQPQEASSLSVIIKDLDDPQKVMEQANRVHDALQPGAAGYQGIVQANNRDQSAVVLSVNTDETSRQQFASQVQLAAGTLDETFQDEQTVLLSQPLAEALGVQIGDPVAVAYDTKFEGMFPARTYRVAAIFTPNGAVTGEMMFLHANQFYETCFPAIPKDAPEVNRQSPLFPVLLKEWVLLERSPDQTALQKKYKALEDSKWRGRVVDVQTMYELASDVLKMEQVLDMITMIAVFVLFLIILIGVVNTLRMTIRERTREIGTVRAIGMQRSDVRWSFVLEVVLLAFFASLAGMVIAFVAMHVLGLPQIESDSMFTMFLVDQRIYFMPTVMDVIKNLIIILSIAFITAYFPARRAAQLSVAEALRHFE